MIQSVKDISKTNIITLDKVIVKIKHPQGIRNSMITFIHGETRKRLKVTPNHYVVV